MDTKLQHTTQALQLAIGLMATLAGLDKFFNILADWGAYVSPLATQVLPISATTLMHLVGVVEVAVGVAVLAAAPAVGSYIASAWLLLVAVNLVAGGHFDVAVRDVVLAVSAFTLARLVEAREDSTAREASRIAAARPLGA